MLWKRCLLIMMVILLRLSAQYVYEEHETNTVRHRNQTEKYNGIE